MFEVTICDLKHGAQLAARMYLTAFFRRLVTRRNAVKPLALVSGLFGLLLNLGGQTKR